jgi:hypothetical protein
MALGTVTKVKAGVFGDLRYTIVDVRPTSGANYVAGGAAFDVAQVPGATGSILAVDVVGGAVDATNKTFVEWDAVTKKLVAYNQTAGTDVGLIEAATNADLSGAAESKRLLVLSK